MTYGVVELGGTKTVVGVGTNPDDLVELTRIATTQPEPTLEAVVAALSDQGIGALGVGSFGPVELRPGKERHGFISRTPKPGWSGTDVAGFLSAGLGVPAGFDTDVNGAALGEWRWGAGRGLDSLVYITVGTGIGGGAVIDGQALHGMAHPEMGHVVVEAHPGDGYPGLCPFHGGCLEGMASGPALRDRFGRPAEELEGTKLERAVALSAFYLAQGLRNVVYAIAPERIVIGGGVSSLEGFHEVVRANLRNELAGYPGIEEHTDDDFVVEPGLGDRSGLAGALAIAESVRS